MIENGEALARNSMYSEQKWSEATKTSSGVGWRRTYATLSAACYESRLYSAAEMNFERIRTCNDPVHVRSRSGASKYTVFILIELQHFTLLEWRWWSGETT